VGVSRNTIEDNESKRMEGKISWLFLVILKCILNRNSVSGVEDDSHQETNDKAGEHGLPISLYSRAQTSSTPKPNARNVNHLERTQ